MFDLFTGAMAEVAFGLLAIVVAAVSLLLRRDRAARALGKRPEQVQARLQAIYEFRRTLERSIPGVLLIILGAFYTVDRMRQHESDGFYGLLFIPVGWLLVWWLTRKSWRRYKALQRVANKSEYDYSVEVPDEFKRHDLG